MSLGAIRFGNRLPPGEARLVSSFQRLSANFRPLGPERFAELVDGHAIGVWGSAVRCDVPPSRFHVGLVDNPFHQNQIEIVFGIVGRRVVRRGNFTSLAALQQRLLDFIAYFNRTFAKPFRWTCTGRPVTAETVKRSATWKENWGSSRANSETLALVG